jgi:3-oxoacyl-[acyl-carrier-protein] synthase III
MFKMRVAGIGSSIPQTCTNNTEIEKRLGLDPGWIERRTGILSRPIADKNLATSDLAIDAAEQALRAACVQPAGIGLLLLATSTPDHLLPPTAPLVAHRLALVHAGAIDLAGACSGFLYALALGSSYGQSMRKPVLVIAANILSRRVDQLDPATVSLFGDGAGAVVLVPDDEPHILGVHLGADGSNYESIQIPAGGTREPMTANSVLAGRHLMKMAKGAVLLRNASHKMAEAGVQAMLQANVRVQDIDWWIPHQANIRLIRETGNILDISEEQTVTVIDQYANSSAATIPIALAVAAASGRIQRGNLLLLTAVGAGMTSAGAVLRW